ncbi:MAG: polyprenyl synthetase family protein [Candidatus Micrarchaeia archaeon]
MKKSSAEKSVEKILSQLKPSVDKAIEKYLPREYSAKSFAFAAGKPRYSYLHKAVSASISRPVWDLFDRGGKRWRPALFLMIVRALGKKPGEFLDYAIIPEVVHNGCLPEDTYILKNPGESVRITDVKRGEFVYAISDQGDLVRRKVLGKKDTGIKDVYLLRTRNREIKATANHPFLVLEKRQPVRCKITQKGRIKLLASLKRGDMKKIAKKIGRSHRVLYNSLNLKSAQLLEKEEMVLIFDFCGLTLETKDYIEKQTKFEETQVTFSWKPLKELRKKDILVVLRETEDLGKPCSLPVPSPNPQEKTRIPKVTTPEFCQIFGYMIGDGVVTINKKSSRIFLLPSNDPVEKKAYSDLFYNLFDYELKAHKHKEYEALCCCSKNLAWLFREMGFGRTAEEKTVPDWIFTLPKKQKLSFVRGLLDSDGWVGKNGTTYFASVSKDLMTKLKLLLDTLGFVTGNLCRKKVKNLWKNSKKKESVLWTIQMSNPKKVLQEIGTEKESYKRRLNVKRRFLTLGFQEDFPQPSIDLAKFMFNRVEEIKPAGSQRVYDLMVEGTHNFIANNVVVHNSLIVDDLEDDSQMRRGKPCIHCLFGVDVAVNAGNALYFLPALSLLKNKEKLGSKKFAEAFEIYVQEMVNLSFGQGADIYWHRGIEQKVSESEYLQMCAFKTGTLARMSAKMAVLLADGSKKQVEAAGNYAEAIGVAFQIQDDVLNLVGDVGLYGKEIGGDISEGKRTLIVIHSLLHSSEPNKRRLLELLNAKTHDFLLIKEAIALLESSGSITYVKQIAKKIVLDSWKDFENSFPKSKARDELKLFADFLIEREF